MRLTYTTALASAVLFAGPALAAGDHVEGTTGMTAPETSAAQIPTGGESGELRQNFASAGFTNWQPADDADIFRMQTADGESVWVVLMPERFQVGGADIGGQMESETGDLAAAPGTDLSEQGGMAQSGEAPDLSGQAEQPDVAEAPELGGPSEQPDVAEAPELGGEAEQPAIAEAPELGGQAEQPDVAEAPELGGQAELPDVAEAPELPFEAGEQADIAEAPEAGQPGIAGETQPEGFAAQIPGDLRSGLEDAGFQQIESVEGSEIFHAETPDGKTAFIIVGDLGGAGSGAGGQQPLDMDQSAPGAAPDLSEPAPGSEPQPSPGQQ